MCLVGPKPCLVLTYVLYSGVPESLCVKIMHAAARELPGETAYMVTH